MVDINASHTCIMIPDTIQVFQDDEYKSAHNGFRDRSGPINQLTRGRISINQSPQDAIKSCDVADFWHISTKIMFL